MKVEISEERKRELDNLFHAFEIVSERAYVFLCDMKYDYSRWSETAVQYFGLPDPYMFHAGDIWEQHIHQDDRKSYRESIQAIFAGTDSGHDMQYRARDRQGRYVVCTCRGSVLRDEDGSPVYFVGSIRNHGLANSVDPLTGFQNQYGLFEYLNVLFETQVKANIMMVGIGHFSTINEMWGYDFGNIVIHKLVQLLKREFRNEGAIYRVDGVRFVLLTQTIPMTELPARFEALKKKISEDLVIDGYNPQLLVYGSAMEIKTFQIKPQAMFSCLEYAYNISREQRDGDFHIFKEETDENRTNLLMLINTIRKSIENDCEGFLLHYQPIIKAKTNTLQGAEALIRWQDPAYGLVPPSKFIPVIENDPVFIRLGEWILHRAMEDIKPFLEKYPSFELNVNLSYQQLRQESFVNMVKRQLEITGFPPHNLYLEITERCRLMDINRLSGVLQELRNIGVRFAIDDFGTGYSSMDILNRLKFEIVKIDKVFVDHVTEHSKNAEIIAAINNLAMACGATVCVEGVETAKQCGIVEQCGVDCIQGYYFSKPLDLSSFSETYGQIS